MQCLGAAARAPASGLRPAAAAAVAAPRARLAPPCAAPKGSKKQQQAAPPEEPVWELVAAGLRLGSAVKVGSLPYNALKAAQLVVYAGLADAGWSGDWSRIGALTEQGEQLARYGFIFTQSAHLVVGVVGAALAASRGGASPIAAYLNGQVFGAMGLKETAVEVGLVGADE
jgi:hypothetical protein